MLKSFDTLGSHIVSYKEAGRQRPQLDNLGDVSSSLFYWSVKSDHAQTKPQLFLLQKGHSNFLKTGGKLPFLRHEEVGSFIHLQSYLKLQAIVPGRHHSNSHRYQVLFCIFHKYGSRELFLSSGHSTLYLILFNFPHSPFIFPKLNDQ